MNKPKLYIMVGISASGKTTIGKQIAEKEKCIVVSSDEIRGEICGDVMDQSKNVEVFKIFHERIKKYLLQGNNVIAEATNINIKSRRAIFENVKNVDCEKIAYIIPKTIEQCIEDNIDKEYPVPHHVIKKQMMNFQIPFYEEGFDQIIIHKLNQPINRYFIINTAYKMRDFNQKNPHHNQTLLDHCIHTWTLFNKKYPNIYGADLHDVGKLFTQKQDENGICRYYQHENVGAYYFLSHFYDIEFGKLNKEKLLEALFLINYHMLPMNWNTAKAKDKWRKIFGKDKFQMLIYFNECDKARLEV